MRAVLMSAICGAIVVPLVAGAPALATTSGSTGLQTAVDAVVVIGTDTGSGSGFAVSDDLIVTAEHVVSGASAVDVQLDSSTVPGTVVASDGQLDLAMVRANGHGLTPIATREGDPILGETVYAMGAPLGDDIRITRGIVSGEADVSGVAHIQTDAAVNPGNSGGPLVDEEGAALGVVVAKVADVEGVAFAVPVEHAVELASGVDAETTPPGGDSSGSDEPDGSTSSPPGVVPRTPDPRLAVAALGVVGLAAIGVLSLRWLSGAHARRRKRPGASGTQVHPSYDTYGAPPIAADVEPVDVILLPPRHSTKTSGLSGPD